jgi:DNA-binding transcriptional MerR regulator
MHTQEDKKYTITETAKISGLPESTLRYYETIGIIKPIERNVNTKRRMYSEDDVNLVVAIACLNATGMSIDNMKAYLDNFNHGEEGAFSQVEILSSQLKHLEEERHYAELRIQYVKAKIDYWKATIKKDNAEIERLRKETYAVADELKLPKMPRF